MNKDIWIAISSIATAALVVVLSIRVSYYGQQVKNQNDTTNILQTQFKEKDRPWMSVEDTILLPNDQIQYVVTNYGAIPNDNGTIETYVDKVIFSRDKLESLLHLKPQVLG